MQTNKNNRRFSYTEPILYNGAYYPTAKVYIDNGNGVAKDSTMFADSNGQYYTMDNDKAYPVDIQYELPEVEVTPSREDILSSMFDRYLTMSNDRTRVNNVPHSEYNTHLRENALRGAREHSLWDKEHPNLSVWRDFATVVPFGVVVAPLVGGLGETTLGQAAISGAEKIMSKPAVKAMDSALGLGFGVKGAYDISQGDVAPMTIFELASVYPSITAISKYAHSKLLPSRNNLTNNILKVGDVDTNTFNFTGFLEDPLQMHLKRARAKGFNTSDINILNISEDTPKTKAFFERTAKQFDMSPEEVKTELINHLDVHGHASAPTWERTIIHDGKGGNATNALLSHEIDHILHYPGEPIPEGVFFPRIKKLYGDEFIKYNNTEVAARGSQIHDYFGHTNKEPITEGMLKYARDNYVKDTGINNNMNDLLWSINDYKGLADWMTKYATGLIPLGIINTTHKNQK